MSESTNKSGLSDAHVLEALVGRKLISQAQADLVKSNSEAMSMSILELLVARHWVNEDVLAGVLAEEATRAGVSAGSGVSSGSGSGSGVSAGSGSGAGVGAATITSGTSGTPNTPNTSKTPTTSGLSQPLSDDYNENLARYKKLIAKILREDGAK